jgi:NAD(P)-dependent dehydrogenase (short-subunit alcohol dehydrogenase family)
MGNSQMMLADKVAVITGGSRGLGFVIAQAYAHQGAAVVIASRSAETVEQAVNDIQSAGGKASGLTCDVADLEQIHALADHAVAKFGSLDIWVNNAGLSCPYGPTITIPPERFTNLINTNILGVYNGSFVAMHHFIPQKRGKLINLIGRGARRPVTMQNAYASSKAWVRNFTLALAKETKESGVGVYLFNPGLVNTDMMQNLHFIQGYEGQLKTFKTIARLWSTNPDVPARKAVWLASSATDARTGLEINLIGPKAILQGIVSEAISYLLKRPARKFDIEATIVKPAMDIDLTDESG